MRVWLICVLFMLSVLAEAGTNYVLVVGKTLETTTCYKTTNSVERVKIDEHGWNRGDVVFITKAEHDIEKDVDSPARLKAIPAQKLSDGIAAWKQWKKDKAADDAWEDKAFQVYVKFHNLSSTNKITKEKFIQEYNTIGVTP